MFNFLKIIDKLHIIPSMMKKIYSSICFVCHMVKPPLFPKVEGKTSRQAHTNLPEGTIELERGREKGSLEEYPIYTKPMLLQHGLT